MARRRINNSKRRKEWRKARAEELAELRALYVDAYNTLAKWKWKLLRNYYDLERQNNLFHRLRARRDRRSAVYRLTVIER